MRPVPFLALAGLVVGLASWSSAICQAGELHNFEDAALHAVQFCPDGKEGWAVGDEGVIWHTIDGGKTWERQPTACRASLRSLHFCNPYFGWVAGREELPGGGSAGVLLFTDDGGLSWQRKLVNALPGLNRVCFLNDKLGYLVGDGAEQYPTGVFLTTDSGRNWQPVAGPRCPSWLAAGFNEAGLAVLAGAWNRLASVRPDRVSVANSDRLGGRSLRGLHFQGKRGLAVGQGGLVLANNGGTGTEWEFVELGLSPEVRATCDFHAVHGAAGHFWVVGRPGCAILHSRDQGQNWEVQQTRQPLPLNGVFFLNETTGWAVGELGSILATTDGGKTWQAQQRGGQRLAVLQVHARPDSTLLDATALLGGRDGYLTGVVRVTAPDGTTAALGRASEGARFSAAVRLAGGAAGEMLWQFPLGSHLTGTNRDDLLLAWNQLHGGEAADQLLRQLVLALRVWRPLVVITDNPDPKTSGSAADGVLVEAVRAACEKAGDARVFPEQLTVLGLEPWSVTKAYARCEEIKSATVTLDLTEVSPLLESSVQEFAGTALSVLDNRALVPAQRSYRLLCGPAETAGHRDLMQGLSLANGGEVRRPLKALGEMPPEVKKAIQDRATLRALSQASGGLASPERLLAQIGPMLTNMPVDQAARAAHGVAMQYVRAGQWNLARETFLLMVERYPAHPLTAEAYRWLLRHNCSSEARRRHELGQFMVVGMQQFGLLPGGQQPVTTIKPSPGLDGGQGASPAQAPPRIDMPRIEGLEIQHAQYLASQGEIKQWYQSSLDLEKKLAVFGPLFTNDPGVQFCLQSARRNLGDFETPRKWYADFVARQPEGPWRSAAAAELWLTNRTGSPPRPVAACKAASDRPYLDGKLDDACWQGSKPLTLQNAAGTTAEDYPTEVRLAYDREFLYVSVRCFHPAGQQLSPQKPRLHDVALHDRDRVSVLLDLDRDYATCYHLQIDQRGCLLEDCWGDRGWNPRWFVALNSEARVWTAEVAIPLMALTGDKVAPGRAWAFNAIRVLPNRGVQAWSLPAEAPEEALRLEGLGLLLFAQDQRQTATAEDAMPRMPRAQ